MKTALETEPALTGRHTTLTPSCPIGQRIRDPGDWRGETLALVRKPVRRPVSEAIVAERAAKKKTLSGTVEVPS